VTVRTSELRAIARRGSLGVLAAALVIAGCAAPGAQESQGPSGSLGGIPSEGAESPRPTPTSSPTSGPSATPLPTLAFEAPANVLPPLSVTTVAVDAIRIHEQPRLSARVVATAGKGEMVYVNSYGGPVAADGVDWYPVGFAAGYRDWPEPPAASALATPGEFPYFIGWAAGGSGAQRYLELAPPRCSESDPDLAILIGMSGWERLACFGDHPLSVEGTYGCGGCDGTMGGDFQPWWLAYPAQLSFLWVEWRISLPPGLTLHFMPEPGADYPAAGSIPAGGSILRVTGHFNDPASATCTMTRFDLDQGLPVLEASAQLYCREQFVVDAFEIIGTDSNYRTLHDQP